MKKYYAFLIYLSLVLIPLGCTADQSPDLSVQKSSEHDLVNIANVCPGIMIEMKYASSNNITGEQIYRVPKCYLHRDAAQALKKVQEELETYGFGLKVWNAYEPPSAQQRIWDLIGNEDIVHNPAVEVDAHARGIAVDVTLVTKDGIELSMPTGFDSINKKADPGYDMLPEHIKNNRKLLKLVTQKHGFVQGDDWWHIVFKPHRNYNRCTIEFDDLP